jgi:hypothetical protein
MKTHAPERSRAPSSALHLLGDAMTSHSSVRLELSTLTSLSCASLTDDPGLEPA